MLKFHKRRILGNKICILSNFAMWQFSRSGKFVLRTPKYKERVRWKVVKVERNFCVTSINSFAFKALPWLYKSWNWIPVENRFLPQFWLSDFVSRPTDFNVDRERNSRKFPSQPIHGISDFSAVPLYMYTYIHRDIQFSCLISFG